MSHQGLEATALPKLALAAPEYPPERQRPSLWRRFWAHPRMIQYHRWFALVVLVNAWVAWRGFEQGWWSGPHQPDLAAIAQTMLANFALAVLIRQQRVINALFWLATRAPTSWPLAVRWQLAKVYHFGGLHSSGALMGSLWFAALLASQLWHVAMGGQRVSALTLGLGMLLLGLLAAILLLARPAYRARQHNRFELMHRFGGWSALALFWAHTLSALADGLPAGAPLAPALIGSPMVWMLALLSLSIASPWLTLKRVRVHAIKPSSHAVVLGFDYGDTPFPGSSNSISLSPLREWHSFANIPAPGERGYRLIVSRAGDWTGALIDTPPRRLWVKGITTAGVAHIEVLFKRVVYIATGSGIGPVLPHLLAAQLPMHLIWATRSPRKTYGDALVDEILRACPDTEIWDTDTHGKPDLPALAVAAQARTGAEAVICIANQKLTQAVIHAVELQGIPGYGAIWDS